VKKVFCFFPRKEAVGLLNQLPKACMTIQKDIPCSTEVELSHAEALTVGLTTWKDNQFWDKA
jgi:hypothetical protein